ncbi:hypothetical protein RHECNPAF_12210092 [Rhizobium etli CNPAF512]|nr:hypothetical protein RHECNPAF_12210092 [Rhizobium etli CNPAF512]
MAVLFVGGLILNRSLRDRINCEKDWLFFFYQICRLFYQRTAKHEDQDFRRPSPAKGVTTIGLYAGERHSIENAHGRQFPFKALDLDLCQLPGRCLGKLRRARVLC